MNNDDQKPLLANTGWFGWLFYQESFLGRLFRKREQSDKALLVLWTVTALGLFGAAAYAYLAADEKQKLSSIFLSVLVCASSIILGGLLGFLFGIPRTLQQDVVVPPPASGAGEGGQAAASRATDYRANTNLEQISDWLTKILVGVGLTQVAAISYKFQQVTFAVADGLGYSPGSRVFASAIIIFFLIDGFLFGYLWTRLYLPGAFRQADVSSLQSGVEEIKDELRQIKLQKGQDAAALNLANRQLNPSGDESALSQAELDNAVKVASPPMLSQIFNLAQNQRANNWQGNKATMELTIPVFRALIAGDTEGKSHQYHAQLAYALKDKTVPDWNAALDELNKAIEIRGGAENGSLFYELNRAACYINTDADFRGNKASALAVREKIIADLRTVVRYNAGIGFRPNSPETAWMNLNGVTMESLA